jgi:hypothetical protein
LLKLNKILNLFYHQKIKATLSMMDHMPTLLAFILDNLITKKDKVGDNLSSMMVPYMKENGIKIP